MLCLAFSRSVIRLVLRRDGCFRSVENVFSLLLLQIFSAIRMIPWVKVQIEEEMEKARRDLEETIHQYDRKKVCFQNGYIYSYNKCCFCATLRLS